MTDFKQDSWDESQDQTEGEIPIILAPPASKASVLEALIIYPVSSGVTALFERRDIYALALSSRQSSMPLTSQTQSLGVV